MAKVDFVLVERGGKYGAECSACGEFFTDDKGRKGNNGMSKAIAHAKEKHGSAEGMVGTKLDTLWSATIRGAGAKSGEEILFRATDDFEAAATTAQALVEGSSACRMIGAVVTQIKRVAHLVELSPPPGKPSILFDTEFLERRMREHREWQEREVEIRALEIIEEIAACLERPRMA